MPQARFCSRCKELHPNDPAPLADYFSHDSSDKYENLCQDCMDHMESVWENDQFLNNKSKD